MADDAASVGAIQGFLKLDISDWMANADIADARGKELGKNSPKIEIQTNAADAIAQLGAVAAAEDKIAASNKKMSSSAKDSAGDFKPLLTAIALLGPTLAPLAIVSAAVFGGVALGAGSVALGIKGIETEMANGTKLGAIYTAGMAQLNGELATIEQSAANGLVTPFNQALSLAKTLFPTVNSEVGQFADVTGQAAVALATGLVGGFVTLRPLLQDVMVDVDHGAVAFQNWASSTGGITKFMATAQAELPIVGHDIGEILAAVLKAGDAFGSTGLTALNALALIARAINAIPIDQLDHLAEIVAISFAAWKGYQVVLLAKSAYDTVATSVQALTGYMSVNSLALQANRASTSAAGLENATFAVSSDGVATALAGSTIAADANAVAMAAMARASAAADISLGDALGPIGLVAAGIGALALVFNSSSSSGEKAKEVMDSYTAAVQADTGAIGDHIKATAAQALQTSGADTAAAKLGITSATLLQATLGNADAQAQVKAATDAATAALNAQAPVQGAGRAAVNANSEALDKQRAGITLVTSSVAQQSTGIKSSIAAYQQWNSALGAYTTVTGGAATATEDLATQQADVNTELGLVTATASKYTTISGYLANSTKTNYQNAVDYAKALEGMESQFNSAGPAASGLLDAMNTFATSAQTDTDRAQLLGAVLLASQGDALAFTGAMAGGKTALDNLVTGFDAAQKAAVNAKTGVIDYTKAGAGPLVSELQSLQTAAVAAAEATYQHEVATKGTTQALTDAQSVFESMTNGTLVANEKQLGITSKEAKGLATNYFAIPTDLTTTVQSVGLSDLNTTLNEIGQLLANLTGQTWVSTLTANTTQYTTAMDAAIALWDQLQTDAAQKQAGPTFGPPQPPVKNNITVGAQTAHQHLADGGFMADGEGDVGEKGPERFVKSGSTVRIFPAPVNGPTATQTPSPAPAAITRSVTVEQTINNPIPEMASVSGPAGLHRAALALGGF